MFVRLSITGRKGELPGEAGGPSKGAASTHRGGLTHLLKCTHCVILIFYFVPRPGTGRPSLLCFAGPWDRERKQSVSERSEIYILLLQIFTFL